MSPQAFSAVRKEPAKIRGTIRHEVGYASIFALEQLVALTDTAVRGAKPGNRPYKIYDRDGLFLLINPSGSKLWRRRYRFDSKEKLMALNEYPVVNLAQTRERQFAARKNLSDGVDPMAERKTEAKTRHREAQVQQCQAENSFESIARGWWPWWSIGKSKRHAETVMNRLEADVFSAIGHLFADAVEP